MSFRNKFAVGCGILTGLLAAAGFGLAIGLYPAYVLGIVGGIALTAKISGIPEGLSLLLLPISLPIGLGAVVSYAIGDKQIKTKINGNYFVRKMRSFFKAEDQPQDQDVTITNQLQNSAKRESNNTKGSASSRYNSALLTNYRLRTKKGGAPSIETAVDRHNNSQNERASTLRHPISF